MTCDPPKTRVRGVQRPFLCDVVAVNAPRKVAWAVVLPSGRVAGTCSNYAHAERVARRIEAMASRVIAEFKRV